MNLRRFFDRSMLIEGFESVNFDGNFSDVDGVFICSNLVDESDAFVAM